MATRSGFTWDHPGLRATISPANPYRALAQLEAMGVFLFSPHREAVGACERLCARCPASAPRGRGPDAAAPQVASDEREVRTEHARASEAPADKRPGQRIGPT